MWYFLVKQSSLDTHQYQRLQKSALLTEVESFNEPNENWFIFSVEKEHYTDFMEQLDREGIGYDLATNRPTRAEMLTSMQ